MIYSMTGFASHQGQLDGVNWTWDIRGVNAKGLDVRLRVPDWIEGLEQGVRGQLTKALNRGSVSLSLRLQKDDGEGALALNREMLDRVLDALNDTEQRAMDKGISLAPSRASDVIVMRGVLDTASAEQDGAALKKALLAELPNLIAAFIEMRRAEGAALHEVMTAQVDRIADLTDQAGTLALVRQDEMAAALRRNLAKVMENTDGMDEARIAQELAVIAVKSDITEEIDRLKAHVVAARDLVATGSPVGRKLDFLMQEFNREANTLCSKAQNADLTAVGLDLKVVIDQMREQVQNVE